MTERDDVWAEPTDADIQEAAEVSAEYARREIEEGITANDLSADDADWCGYSSQFPRREEIRAALGKTFGGEF